MFATIAGALGWMLDRTASRPSGTGPRERAEAVG